MKRSTNQLNSAGSSKLTTWPVRGTTASCAVGISRFIHRLTSSVGSSSSPSSRRTGAAIAFNSGSRSQTEARAATTRRWTLAVACAGCSESTDGVLVGVLDPRRSKSKRLRIDPARAIELRGLGMTMCDELLTRGIERAAASRSSRARQNAIGKLGGEHQCRSRGSPMHHRPDRPTERAAARGWRGALHPGLRRIRLRCRRCAAA